MLIIQRPEVESGEADGNTQSFVISPLEPGFGHTLGNSLRRTLLSSIPGAAVTQVRFDEALHEFDTIPGVKEDVTDLILNLKDLVLRCTADEPVTLRLDKRGPGDVHRRPTSRSRATSRCSTASSTSRPSTPRAASRSTSRSSRAAATSRRSATRRRRRSASSPSTRSSRRCGGCRSRSSRHRVEQATNYDKLTVEIETDGSITPREALASAGDTLRSLVSLVADLSDEPKGLELGEVSPTTSASPDLELPIEELDLSERPRNCLKRARVDTIGQLVQKTEDDLLAITNFGSKSLEEVLQKLDERGLSLRVKE